MAPVNNTLNQSELRLHQGPLANANLGEIDALPETPPETPIDVVNSINTNAPIQASTLLENPDTIVDPSAPEVVAQLQKLHSEGILTHEMSADDIVLAIHRHITSILDHQPQDHGWQSASEVFQRGVGDQEGLAIAEASLIAAALLKEGTAASQDVSARVAVILGQQAQGESHTLISYTDDQQIQRYIDPGTSLDNAPSIHDFEPLSELDFHPLMVLRYEHAEVLSPPQKSGKTTEKSSDIRPKNDVLNAQNLIDSQDNDVQAILSELESNGTLSEDMTDDEVAIAIHTYVIENYQYRSDDEDHWASVSETIASGQGDCEDLAILEASLLTAAFVQRGQPIASATDRVSVVAGVTANGDGHMFVSYQDSHGQDRVFDPTNTEATPQISDFQLVENTGFTTYFTFTDTDTTIYSDQAYSVTTSTGTGSQSNTVNNLELSDEIDTDTNESTLRDIQVQRRQYAPSTENSNYSRFTEAPTSANYQIHNPSIGNHRQTLSDLTMLTEDQLIYEMGQYDPDSWYTSLEDDDIHSDGDDYTEDDFLALNYDEMFAWSNRLQNLINKLQMLEMIQSIEHGLTDLAWQMLFGYEKSQDEEQSNLIKDRREFASEGVQEAFREMESYVKEWNNTVYKIKQQAIAEAAKDKKDCCNPGADQLYQQQQMQILNEKMEEVATTNLRSLNTAAQSNSFNFSPDQISSLEVALYDPDTGASRTGNFQNQGQVESELTDVDTKDVDADWFFDLDSSYFVNLKRDLSSQFIMFRITAEVYRSQQSMKNTADAALLGVRGRNDNWDKAQSQNDDRLSLVTRLASKFQTHKVEQASYYREWVQNSINITKIEKMMKKAKAMLIGAIVLSVVGVIATIAVSISPAGPAAGAAVALAFTAGVTALTTVTLDEIKDIEDQVSQEYDPETIVGSNIVKYFRFEEDEAAIQELLFGINGDDTSGYLTATSEDDAHFWEIDDTKIADANLGLTTLFNIQRIRLAVKELQMDIKSMAESSLTGTGTYTVGSGIQSQLEYAIDLNLTIFQGIYFDLSEIAFSKTITDGIEKRKSDIDTQIENSLIMAAVIMVITVATAGTAAYLMALSATSAVIATIVSLAALSWTIGLTVGTFMAVTQNAQKSDYGEANRSLTSGSKLKEFVRRNQQETTQSNIEQTADETFSNLLNNPAMIDAGDEYKALDISQFIEARVTLDKVAKKRLLLVMLMNMQQEITNTADSALLGISKSRAFNRLAKQVVSAVNSQTMLRLNSIKTFTNKQIRVINAARDADREIEVQRTQMIIVVVIGIIGMGMAIAGGSMIASAAAAEQAASSIAINLSIAGNLAAILGSTIGYFAAAGIYFRDADDGYGDLESPENELITSDTPSRDAQNQEAQSLNNQRQTEAVVNPRAAEETAFLSVANNASLITGTDGGHWGIDHGQLAEINLRIDRMMRVRRLLIRIEERRQKIMDLGWRAMTGSGIDTSQVSTANNVIDIDHESLQNRIETRQSRLEAIVERHNKMLDLQNSAWTYLVLAIISLILAVFTAKLQSKTSSKNSLEVDANTSLNAAHTTTKLNTFVDLLLTAIRPFVKYAVTKANESKQESKHAPESKTSRELLNEQTSGTSIANRTNIPQSSTFHTGQERVQPSSEFSGFGSLEVKTAQRQAIAGTNEIYLQRHQKWMEMQEQLHDAWRDFAQIAATSVTKAVSNRVVAHIAFKTGYLKAFTNAPDVQKLIINKIKRNPKKGMAFLSKALEKKPNAINTNNNQTIDLSNIQKNLKGSDPSKSLNALAELQKIIEAALSSNKSHRSINAENLKNKQAAKPGVLKAEKTALEKQKKTLQSLHNITNTTLGATLFNSLSNSASTNFTAAESFVSKNPYVSGLALASHVNAIDASIINRKNSHVTKTERNTLVTNIMTSDVISKESGIGPKPSAILLGTLALSHRRGAESTIRHLASNPIATPQSDTPLSFTAATLGLEPGTNIQPTLGKVVAALTTNQIITATPSATYNVTPTVNAEKIQNALSAIPGNPLTPDQKTRITTHVLAHIPLNADQQFLSAMITQATPQQAVEIMDSLQRGSINRNLLTAPMKTTLFENALKSGGARKKSSKLEKGLLVLTKIMRSDPFNIPVLNFTLKAKMNNSSNPVIQDVAPKLADQLFQTPKDKIAFSKTLTLQSASKFTSYIKSQGMQMTQASIPVPSDVRASLTAITADLSALQTALPTTATTATTATTIQIAHNNITAMIAGRKAVTSESLTSILIAVNTIAQQTNSTDAKALTSKLTSLNARVAQAESLTQLLLTNPVATIAAQAAASTALPLIVNAMNSTVTSAEATTQSTPLTAEVIQQLTAIVNATTALALPNTGLPQQQTNNIQSLKTRAEALLLQPQTSQGALSTPGQMSPVVSMTPQAIANPSVPTLQQSTSQELAHFIASTVVSAPHSATPLTTALIAALPTPQAALQTGQHAAPPSYVEVKAKNTVQTLATTHPVQTATLLSKLPPQQAVAVLTNITNISPVLNTLAAKHPAQTATLLSMLPTNQTVAFLNTLTTPQLSSFVQRLTPIQQGQVLQSVVPAATQGSTAFSQEGQKVLAEVLPNLAVSVIATNAPALAAAITTTAIPPALIQWMSNTASPKDAATVLSNLPEATQKAVVTQMLSYDAMSSPSLTDIQQKVITILTTTQRSPQEQQALSNALLTAPSNTSGTPALASKIPLLLQHLNTTVTQLNNPTTTTQAAQIIAQIPGANQDKQTFITSPALIAAVQSLPSPATTTASTNIDAILTKLNTAVVANQASTQPVHDLAQSAAHLIQHVAPLNTVAVNAFTTAVTTNQTLKTALALPTTTLPPVAPALNTLVATTEGRAAILSIVNSPAVSITTKTMLIAATAQATTPQTPAVFTTQLATELTQLLTQTADRPVQQAQLLQALSQLSPEAARTVVHNLNATQQETLVQTVLQSDIAPTLLPNIMSALEPSVINNNAISITQVAPAAMSAWMTQAPVDTPVDAAKVLTTMATQSTQGQQHAATLLTTIMDAPSLTPQNKQAILTQTPATTALIVQHDAALLVNSATLLQGTNQVISPEVTALVSLIPKHAPVLAIAAVSQNVNEHVQTALLNHMPQQERHALVNVNAAPLAVLAKITAPETRNQQTTALAREVLTMPPEKAAQALPNILTPTTHSATIHTEVLTALLAEATTPQKQTTLAKALQIASQDHGLNIPQLSDSIKTVLSTAPANSPAISNLGQIVQQTTPELRNSLLMAVAADQNLVTQLLYHTPTLAAQVLDLPNAALPNALDTPTPAQLTAAKNSIHQLQAINPTNATALGTAFVTQHATQLTDTSVQTVFLSLPVEEQVALLQNQAITLDAKHALVPAILSHYSGSPEDGQRLLEAMTNGMTDQGVAELISPHITTLSAAAMIPPTMMASIKQNAPTNTYIPYIEGLNQDVPALTPVPSTPAEQAQAIAHAITTSLKHGNLEKAEQQLSLITNNKELAAKVLPMVLSASMMRQLAPLSQKRIKEHVSDITNKRADAFDVTPFISMSTEELGAVLRPIHQDKQQQGQARFTNDHTNINVTKILNLRAHVDAIRSAPLTNSEIATLVSLSDPEFTAIEHAVFQKTLSPEAFKTATTTIDNIKKHRKGVEDIISEPAAFNVDQFDNQDYTPSIIAAALHLKTLTPIQQHHKTVNSALVPLPAADTLVVTPKVDLATTETLLTTLTSQQDISPSLIPAIQRNPNTLPLLTPAFANVVAASDIYTHPEGARNMERLIDLSPKETQAAFRAELSNTSPTLVGDRPTLLAPLGDKQDVFATRYFALKAKVDAIVAVSSEPPLTEANAKKSALSHMSTLSVADQNYLTGDDGNTPVIEDITYGDATPLDRQIRHLTTMDSGKAQLQSLLRSNPEVIGHIICSLQANDGPEAQDALTQLCATLTIDIDQADARIAPHLTTPLNTSEHTHLNLLSALDQDKLDLLTEIEKVKTALPQSSSALLFLAARIGAFTHHTPHKQTAYLPVLQPLVEESQFEIQKAAFLNSLDPQRVTTPQVLATLTPKDLETKSTPTTHARKVAKAVALLSKKDLGQAKKIISELLHNQDVSDEVKTIFVVTLLKEKTALTPDLVSELNTENKKTLRDTVCEEVVSQLNEGIITDPSMFFMQGFRPVGIEQANIIDTTSSAHKDPAWQKISADILSDNNLKPVVRQRVLSALPTQYTTTQKLNAGTTYLKINPKKIGNSMRPHKSSSWGVRRYSTAKLFSDIKANNQTNATAVQGHINQRNYPQALSALTPSNVVSALEGIKSKEKTTGFLTHVATQADPLDPKKAAKIFWVIEQSGNHKLKKRSAEVMETLKGNSPDRHSTLCTQIDALSHFPAPSPAAPQQPINEGAPLDLGSLTFLSGHGDLARQVRTTLSEAKLAAVLAQDSTKIDLTPQTAGVLPLATSWKQQQRVDAALPEMCELMIVDKATAYSTPTVHQPRDIPKDVLETVQEGVTVLTILTHDNIKITEQQNMSPRAAAPAEVDKISACSPAQLIAACNAAQHVAGHDLFPKENVIPKLVELSRDLNPHVQVAATRALSQLQPESRDTALNLHRHFDTFCKQARSQDPALTQSEQDITSDIDNNHVPALIQMVAVRFEDLKASYQTAEKSPAHHLVQTAVAQEMAKLLTLLETVSTSTTTVNSQASLQSAVKSLRSKLRNKHNALSELGSAVAIDQLKGTDNVLDLLTKDPAFYAKSMAKMDGADSDKALSHLERNILETDLSTATSDDKKSAILSCITALLSSEKNSDKTVSLLTRLLESAQPNIQYLLKHAIQTNAIQAGSVFSGLIKGAYRNTHSQKTKESLVTVITEVCSTKDDAQSLFRDLHNIFANIHIPDLLLAVKNKKPAFPLKLTDVVEDALANKDHIKLGDIFHGFHLLNQNPLRPFDATFAEILDKLYNNPEMAGETFTYLVEQKGVKSDSVAEEILTLCLNNSHDYFTAMALSNMDTQEALPLILSFRQHVSVDNFSRLERILSTHQTDPKFPHAALLLGHEIHNSELSSVRDELQKMVDRNPDKGTNDVVISQLLPGALASDILEKDPQDAANDLLLTTDNTTIEDVVNEMFAQDRSKTIPILAALTESAVFDARPADYNEKLTAILSIDDLHQAGSASGTTKKTKGTAAIRQRRNSTRLNNVNLRYDRALNMIKRYSDNNSPAYAIRQGKANARLEACLSTPFTTQGASEIVDILTEAALLPPQINVDRLKESLSDPDKKTAASAKKETLHLLHAAIDGTKHHGSSRLMSTLHTVMRHHDQTHLAEINAIEDTHMVFYPNAATELAPSLLKIQPKTAVLELLQAERYNDEPKDCVEPLLALNPDTIDDTTLEAIGNAWTTLGETDLDQFRATVEVMRASITLTPSNSAIMACKLFAAIDKDITDPTKPHSAALKTAWRDQCTDLETALQTHADVPNTKEIAKYFVTRMPAFARKLSQNSTLMTTLGIPTPATPTHFQDDHIKQDINAVNTPKEMKKVAQDRCRDKHRNSEQTLTDLKSLAEKADPPEKKAALIQGLKAEFPALEPVITIQTVDQLTQIPDSLPPYHQGLTPKTHLEQCLRESFAAPNLPTAAAALTAWKNPSTNPKEAVETTLGTTEEDQPEKLSSLLSTTTSIQEMTEVLELALQSGVVTESIMPELASTIEVLPLFISLLHLADEHNTGRNSRLFKAILDGDIVALFTTMRTKDQIETLHALFALWGPESDYMSTLLGKTSSLAPKVQQRIRFELQNAQFERKGKTHQTIRGNLARDYSASTLAIRFEKVAFLDDKNKLTGVRKLIKAENQINPERLSKALHLFLLHNPQLAARTFAKMHTRDFNINKFLCASKNSALIATYIECLNTYFVAHDPSKNSTKGTVAALLSSINTESPEQSTAILDALDQVIKQEKQQKSDQTEKMVLDQLNRITDPKRITTLITLSFNRDKKEFKYEFAKKAFSMSFKKYSRNTSKTGKKIAVRKTGYLLRPIANNSEFNNPLLEMLWEKGQVAECKKLLTLMTDASKQTLFNSLKSKQAPSLLDTFITETINGTKPRDRNITCFQKHIKQLELLNDPSSLDNVLYQTSASLPNLIQTLEDSSIPSEQVPGYLAHVLVTHPDPSVQSSLVQQIKEDENLNKEFSDAITLGIAINSPHQSKYRTFQRTFLSDDTTLKKFSSSGQVKPPPKTITLTVKEDPAYWDAHRATIQSDDSFERIQRSLDGALREYTEKLRGIEKNAEHSLIEGTRNIPQRQQFEQLMRQGQAR